MQFNLKRYDQDYNYKAQHLQSGCPRMIRAQHLLDNSPTSSSHLRAHKERENTLSNLGTNLPYSQSIIVSLYWSSRGWSVFKSSPEGIFADYGVLTLTVGLGKCWLEGHREVTVGNKSALIGWSALMCVPKRHYLVKGTVRS